MGLLNYDSSDKGWQPEQVIELCKLLRITQTELACLICLKPATLARYMRRKRGIPPEVALHFVILRQWILERQAGTVSTPAIPIGLVSQRSTKPARTAFIFPNSKPQLTKQMPHYKNGREAKYGDPVVGRPYNGSLVQVGNLIDIVPGTQSCNAVLVRAIGSDMTCVSVGDFFHADDAYGVISAPLVQAPASTPPVDCASAGLPTQAAPPSGSGCVCEATAAAE